MVDEASSYSEYGSLVFPQEVRRQADGLLVTRANTCLQKEARTNSSLLRILLVPWILAFLASWACLCLWRCRLAYEDANRSELALLREKERRAKWFLWSLAVLALVTYDVLFLLMVPPTGC